MHFLKRLVQQFNGALFYLWNAQPESIGGQAVMEGVMMRSPRRLAVAVRSPEGNIVIDNKIFVPYSKRFKIFSLPILRGAASLIESLAIGVKALNFSMEVLEGKVGSNASKAKAEATANTDSTEIKKENLSEDSSSFSKKATWKDNALLSGSLGVSFVFAIALFQLLPYATVTWLVGGNKDVSPNPVLFNFTAGAVRIALLLGYMKAISYFKDMKRIFEYHGAEHKSIFAYEQKVELTVANARMQTRFHPRCGTSFILIVGMVCIAYFSAFDSLLLYYFHLTYPNFLFRFLVHLPMVPLVAGLSFEVLKFTAKHQDSIWVKPFILPGLWLQKITTQEPDDSELEVALASIHAALE